MRTLLLCLVIIVSFALTGCDVLTLPGSGSSSNQTAKVTVTKMPRPTALKPNRATKADGQKGIRIDKVESPVVHVGDSDGLYLGNYVEATHLCDNGKPNAMSIGTPRWGCLKGYATGHSRYYPPSRPCEDQIEVDLLADDGCRETTTLTIQVLDEGATTAQSIPKTIKDVVRPVKSEKAGLVIVAPSNGYKNNGRICRINGQSTGYVEYPLDIVVINEYGIAYVQDSHPEIRKNRFDGWVYLGDEQGNGIGERFRIVVKSSDGKVISNTVTVTRAS